MPISRKRGLAAAAAALLVVAALVAIARCGGGRSDDRSAEPRAATSPRDEGARARRDAIHRAQRNLDAKLPRLTLRGTVVDREDRPVAGAAVVLGQGPRQVTSGADGGFAIDGLAPGVYAIEARSGDRVGGPHRVVLSAETGPVTLRLYRGAIAEVEVVSAADGRPIAGAEVSAWQLSMYPGGGRHHAITDARGIARFEALTLVAHEVLAAAPDHAMRTDTLDPMLAGDGTWRLRIELDPGATVAGRVVDESGAPIAGAVVELHGDPGDGDSPRQSDAGRYGADRRAGRTLGDQRRARRLPGRGVADPRLRRPQRRVRADPGAHRRAARHRRGRRRR
jgi:hypothetical protein